MSECCPPNSDQSLLKLSDGDDIKAAVRERYTQVATGEISCCGSPAEHPRVQRVRDYGYEVSILGDEVPTSVLDSFAGCGNPLAIDTLHPGEVVLDLGSGAGLDCFLAAKKVGPTGHVIGLDMTEAMLEKARKNQALLGLTNVEFRKGEMEQMPVGDASIDVIISNCVINLSPDKDAVFREAFRVLKPGGRLMVADIATVGELPEELRTREAWTGCIGGAIPLDEYLGKLKAAGFTDVQVIASQEWQPMMVSAKIKAVKP
ncbi:MAG TPA: arsenite methyltransferase [Alphaproteobacteria bacterium]|nr:arsenite methyltransferase [Alphaproteobacteria bacterium]